MIAIICRDEGSYECQVDRVQCHDARLLMDALLVLKPALAWTTVAIVDESDPSIYQSCAEDDDAMPLPHYIVDRIHLVGLVNKPESIVMRLPVQVRMAALIQARRWWERYCETSGVNPKWYLPAMDWAATEIARCLATLAGGVV